MTRFILSVFVISLAGTLTLNAQQIKIAVQKEQKFKSELTSQITTSAQVMGQSIESTTDLSSTTMYKVMSAGPDGFDLTETIIKLKLDAAVMGQNMNYDSEKKDNSGPIADAVNGSINNARAISLNSKGEITKQEAANVPDLGPLDLGLGGNEATTGLFIPVLLERELKAGDSITDITTIKTEKNNSRDSGTYTIVAIENGIASINYTGTQVSTTVMEQMGIEMTSSNNNKVSKELQVDIKTGVVLMKKTTVEISSNIDAGGMTIPSSGKTITTVLVTPAGN